MGEAAFVVVCFSGSEALARLAGQAFDVVVSDFKMPGFSGLVFLDRIRQDHREIILVLITTYRTAALEVGVRQLGVGYITRPFEPSSLAQFIKDLIQAEEIKSNMESTSRIVDKLGETAGSSSIVFGVSPINPWQPSA